MYESLTINDVSKALGIPASTLRHWDKEGLLRFERNEENNYRIFSFQTMVDISHIMLLRKLEIPLYTLKRIGDMSSENLLNLLDDTKLELKKKISYLERVTKQIELREEMFLKFQEMQQHKPTIVKAQLDTISFFDFSDERSVQLYLSNPGLSADLIKKDDPNHYICGVFDDSGSKIIRKKDTHEKEYLYGLLWMNRKGETNVESLIIIAENMGFRTGDTICRHIISAKENQQEYRDYFEAWVEIIE